MHEMAKKKLLSALNIPFTVYRTYRVDNTSFTLQPYAQTIYIEPITHHSLYSHVHRLFIYSR